jgi:hypothetical protein
MLMRRREPVGAAVSEAPEAVHPLADGSEGRRSSGAETRACRSGVERDDADDAEPARRSRIVVRDVRLMADERAGDGPERVKGRCPGCDLS